MNKFRCLSFITLLTVMSLITVSVGANEGDLVEKVSEQTVVLDKIKKTLDDIKEDTTAIISPTWEYKQVIPNMLNSKETADEVIIDGVNFTELGEQGWELVFYSDNYGFLFKRKK